MWLRPVEPTVASPDDRPASHQRVDRLELLGAILMAIAAVATAWSSYQATRWNGEQAVAASRTNAIRIDAARAAGLANAESEVDVATFIAWADADLRDDAAVAAFFQDRFRDEFRTAFDAWLDTDPLTDPDAPPTPFSMPEYQVESKLQAEQLDEQAEASAALVRRNILRASNYVLAVVLFAVALFFAGMSTKLSSRRLRGMLLACGYTILGGALVWLALSPVSIRI
jgi:hypothetical protein